MVLSKGQFAQRDIGKGVDLDLRKTEHIWGFRVMSGDEFEDVEVSASIRDVTDREANYFGINEAAGLIKVSIAGTVSQRQKTLGPIGDITTEHNLIRGSSVNTAGTRDYLVDAETFDIERVHTVYNAGVPQEFWLFARPTQGG